MINVAISYKPFGSSGTSAWFTLNTFQRPVMYSEKIDETLDFGQLVFQATQLYNLPPFTYIRIIVTDGTGESVTFYAVTGSPEQTMVRAV